jgi:threonyl-tRNA synthetase
MDVIALNQTAAEYLAHAAVDLFPHTILLGGRGTSRYFYYDFSFPFPFHPQTLSLIEERMQRLLKANVRLKKREMLASNAAEFFASRSQNGLAEKLSTLDGLATICEINDFFDYCPYDFSLEWPFPPQIKLIETEEIEHEGQPAIRIIGALATDKQALKALLKAPSPIASNHRKFAVEQKLLIPLEDGHWAWLPKGELLRQILLAEWQKIIVKEKFHTVSTYCPDHREDGTALLRCHQEVFSQTKICNLAEVAYFSFENDTSSQEGLFETKTGFTDRLTLFCTEENFLQSCISYLHFILEMPRILGFEYQLTLGQSTAKRTKYYRILQEILEKKGLKYVVEKNYRSGSEAWIEVKCADAMGRLWSGPFMSVPEKMQVPTLVCSLLGTMERLVGLMLEQNTGVLPLWIAPEQVRLLLLSDEARPYAERVQCALENKGVRSVIDEQKGDLGSRLYQAIMEKIPFAVILGDREMRAETLVVRALGSKKEERMDVDALASRIREVNERELQPRFGDQIGVLQFTRE